MTAHLWSLPSWLARRCYVWPMTTPPQQNLFGSCSFYVLAAVVSTVFAMSGCIAEENKKAESEAADTRARSLATRASAVTACEDWMRELYGEGDRNFAVTGHEILRAQTFNYSMSITFNSTSVLNKKVFSRTEDCRLVWDHSEDAWEPQPR